MYTLKSTLFVHTETQPHGFNQAGRSTSILGCPSRRRDGKTSHCRTHRPLETPHQAQSTRTFVSTIPRPMRMLSLWRTKQHSVHLVEVRSEIGVVHVDVFGRGLLHDEIVVPAGVRRQEAQLHKKGISAHSAIASCRR
ncbi:unnamed protein product, partial [Ectocarpus sp. 4 AP-2014]